MLRRCHQDFFQQKAYPSALPFLNLQRGRWRKEGEQFWKLLSTLLAIANLIQKLSESLENLWELLGPLPLCLLPSTSLRYVFIMLSSRIVPLETICLHLIRLLAGPTKESRVSRARVWGDVCWSVSVCGFSAGSCSFLRFPATICCLLWRSATLVT